MWKPGVKLMLVHDNTNNALRICTNENSFQVNVGLHRESSSWWAAEIVHSSWRVPFYSLEPFNYDLNSKPLFIVYGGGICLRHAETGYHLNSERNLRYSGFHSSDEQLVSAVPTVNSNTMWIVKGQHKPDDRYNFVPKKVVQNGDIIRLEHYNTQSNLHSHSSYQSPVTKQQEVTCYGHDGVGDTNDNFRVEIGGGEKAWGINAKVRLIHVNTNHALHSHERKLHDNEEPHEVTAYSRRDNNDLWIVVFLELLFS